MGKAVEGPHLPPNMCYSCRCGENTKETLERRAAHEAKRGVKKVH